MVNKCKLDQFILNWSFVYSSWNDVLTGLNVANLTSGHIACDLCIGIETTISAAMACGTLDCVCVSKVHITYSRFIKSSQKQGHFEINIERIDIVGKCGALYNSSSKQKCKISARKFILPVNLVKARQIFEINHSSIGANEFWILSWMPKISQTAEQNGKAGQN